MRRCAAVALFLLMMILSMTASTKDAGSSVLKDVQPAGTTEKKHKHQQYDMSFTSSMGKEYTCRTEEKLKVKAPDLPVGSNITYEVKGNKGKVKTAAGKDYSCTIVRVSNVPDAPK
jgi:hypothetical protein